MAQFRAFIISDRGIETTRLGRGGGNTRAGVDSYNIGVSVQTIGENSLVDGVEEGFIVSRTRGSGHKHGTHKLAQIHVMENGDIEILHYLPDNKTIREVI